MRNLTNELRQALRLLLRYPTVTVTAGITLALGIGANTAIFSVVHSVLLRPLPLADPESLVIAWGYHPEIGTETASYPDFLDWREQATVFEDLVATSTRSVNLTGEGEPERLTGTAVSAGFFRLLGRPPTLGRGFLPEDDRPGDGEVVVVGHGLWHRRFGGDPAILGRQLRLNGEAHTVIGVARPGFEFPRGSQLWVPLALDVAQTGRRSDFLVIGGRLAPGITLAAAQQEMDTIAARLEEAYPATNAGWGVRLVPLHEQQVQHVRAAMLIVFAAVAAVLLIACVNVANLLLVRASSRRREMAIRASLGAGRFRLLRQVLLESVVLAAFGGAAGLLFAQWGIALLQAIAPEGVPRLETARVDGPVLAFTLLLSVGTALLFGIAPGLRACSRRFLGTLTGHGRDALSSGRSGGRSVLVVAEVGLSLVLLISAGLTLRSFGEVLAVDPGFRTESLLTIRLGLPASSYPEPAQVAGFYEGVLERVRALPGVRAASMTNAPPLSGGGPWWSISIDDRPDPPPETVQDANIRFADPAYFRTMGIELLRGRPLAPSDRSDAPPVVLINETMERRYWPEGDALGRRVAFDGTDDGPTFREIVGVVADTRHEGLDRDEVRAIYLPHAQRPARYMTLMIQAEGDPLALVGAVRAQLREVDPEQPIHAVQTMAERLRDSVAQRRFAMILLAAFAVVALLLAAVGLYGVLSYSVTQRSQELGLRMALGARRADVLRLVLGRGMAMAAAGLACGLLGAVAVTRWLEVLLFGISSTDPATFAALPALVAAVAAVATLLPARRATRLDPVKTLREE